MDLVLIRAITWFCSILQMMLVVTAVLSWFAGTSEFMRGLYQMGTQLTSPLVDPIRKILYRLGTDDCIFANQSFPGDSYKADNECFLGESHDHI